MTQQTTEDRLDIRYCANHPNVETSLSCARCGKPICAKCAVLTPTGYKCRECVRGQQKVFETATSIDYPIAFISTALLAFLGSLLVQYTGFFTLFIAPVAGTVIAEVVRFLLRKRRGRRLFQLAAVAALVGSLPLLLLGLGVTIYAVSSFGLRGAGGSWGLIWQALYAAVVTSTVYYRLSGIQLKF